MQPPPGQEAARVFIAIPLYCSTDEKVFEYFSSKEYCEELDRITGADLIVTVPREMRERGNFVVYDKVREHGRFRMEVSDLPCIYVEDDQHGWVAIKLRDDVQQLREVFKALATAARKAGPRTTASELAREVRSRLRVRVVFPLAPQAIAEGDFERVLNKLAKLADPALHRHAMAKCEARVARIDFDNKAVGTAWLVGPDLLLTAYHNVRPYTAKWPQVTALFDHKFVPQAGSQFLEPGRGVRLADPPLLASSDHPSKDVELTKEGATAEYLDFALLRLAERVGDEALSREDPAAQIRGLFHRLAAGLKKYFGARSDAAGQPRGWFQLPGGRHDFDPQQGLLILGHPQVKSEGSVYPLKLATAVPSGARLTPHGCRVRYAVNTEVGSSGSPVMDEDFSPLALHHLGSDGKPDWDADGVWPEGFNQGIPLSLIVDAIRSQVNGETLRELGLAEA